MTAYLFKKYEDGKISQTAHLSYDGETPLCETDGEFIQDEEKKVVFVCSVCHDMAYMGSWEIGEKPK